MESNVSTFWWKPDLETNLIINEVASELGLESKVVKEVITTYYKNVSVVMESNEMPRILIHGLGRLFPVPAFIKKRIVYLSKNDSVKNDAAIEKLTEIMHREMQFRLKSKKTKKK